MFPLLALGDPVMVSLGQVIVTDFPDEMGLGGVGGSGFVKTPSWWVMKGVSKLVLRGGDELGDWD